jgi:hypothetical protein
MPLTGLLIYLNRTGSFITQIIKSTDLMPFHTGNRVLGSAAEPVQPSCPDPVVVSFVIACLPGRRKGETTVPAGSSVCRPPSFAGEWIGLKKNMGKGISGRTLVPGVKGEISNGCITGCRMKTSIVPPIPLHHPRRWHESIRRYGRAGSGTPRAHPRGCRNTGMDREYPHAECGVPSEGIQRHPLQKGRA